MRVEEMAAELQSLQRQRAWHLKSRNMVSNRLQATVAGAIGYSSGLKEAERRKLFIEAGKIIKRVVSGEMESDQEELINTTMNAINGFDGMKKELEKRMTKMSQSLPVASWVEEKNQRGFGILFLAVIIGETGDLAGYANPAKVWRRLGCAPYTKDGETLMGATWRSRGGGKKGKTKLLALDWEDFGYSPRRRSIAYLIGEGMVKQNFPNGEKKPGPYRKRYDESKVTFHNSHPDYTPLRCHLHGMLLASKLLLKNLWIEWNGHPKYSGWKK